MAKFLYFTENKPSRKAASEFTTWLKDNYPECSFIEVNVGGRTGVRQLGGRYQGRVEAPEPWSKDTAQHCQAVFDAARRMLTE